MPEGAWTSVTDRLCIGPSPLAVLHDCDVAQGARLICDGLCIAVADDATAVAVLVELGVEPDQAARQVRWSHGDVGR
jgi:hypothetical protein